MPSPFPGMDPYLEHPGLWPDVHHRLIEAGSEILLAAVRPKYFVQIDERLYVASTFDESPSGIIPDMHIREVPTPHGIGSGGGTALLADPSIEFETKVGTEISESYIQIVDREHNRVVTVIEILSPANKTANAAGRESYLAKREEVMRAKTNMVEIDLLRMKPPIYSDPRLRGCDYLAMSSEWTNGILRRRGWPMWLQERLKRIEIPLKQGDKPAVLDLQAVLNTAYQRAGYELRVDYSKEPVPPLQGEAAQWAREQIDKARASQ